MLMALITGERQGHEVVTDGIKVPDAFISSRERYHDMVTVV